MPKTQAIGPWDGGLNLSSSRDLSPFLDNNELGIALNVQLTPEGFVESRPGYKVLDAPFNTDSPLPVITILGTINIQSEYVTVVQVCAADTKIYYVRGDKTVHYKATFALATKFTSVLALRNSETSPAAATEPRGVFIFSGTAANECYRLEEVPNVTAAATPTLMSSTLAIPASDFSFAVKDRVFLVHKASSTVYWSATLEFSLYFREDESTPQGKATGSVKLEPSVDLSDNITSVQFLNNNFYLFKKSSAFMFTYQADPENDGYLRKFNDDLGAFDSTLFRNTVVVLNNRGVFTVEGTEFIDIQQKLNLRFETPLDNRSAAVGFISNFNNMLLIGFKTSSSSTKEYHYILNGNNRGWTEWDFEYAAPMKLASPGSNGYFTQYPVGKGIILHTTFGKSRLIYSDWKPLPEIYDYSLDGTMTRDAESEKYVRYIPTINVQTRTMLGDSILDYKKLLRAYVRLYISDLPYEMVGGEWLFSINYNDFYFVSTNPSYVLRPQEARTQTYAYDEGMEVSLIPVGEPEPIPYATVVNTYLYKRTYQIPIPQHRVKEFTFQISRQFTRLEDIVPKNASADRPVQAGYYFMLSGFWADYNEKARL